MDSIWGRELKKVETHVLEAHSSILVVKSAHETQEDMRHRECWRLYPVRRFLSNLKVVTPGELVIANRPACCQHTDYILSHIRHSLGNLGGDFKQRNSIIKLRNVWSWLLRLKSNCWAIEKLWNITTKRMNRKSTERILYHYFVSGHMYWCRLFCECNKLIAQKSSSSFVHHFPTFESSWNFSTQVCSSSLDPPSRRSFIL